MRDLFGCDDYLKADGLPPRDRKEFLASLYERQLREFGNFPYVSRFEMIEKNGRTSYFLYHCTRNLKGLEVMRSAMWKIDPNSSPTVSQGSNHSSKGPSYSTWKNDCSPGSPGSACRSR
jgi:hypothetical protein